MDINSLQQINTFVGGMNTDTSDALLESNQYRYAENVRIVTNTDSNTGELRVIEGTLEFIKNDAFRFNGDKDILYMTSVRQYGIIILKVDDAWCIYRFKKDDEKPTLIFGPCIEPIWDEKTGVANLSVVTRYESEKNIKMYIADGIHQIMCINIADTYEDDEQPTSFDFIAQHFRTILPKLDVQVSNNKSGQIPSAKVQYAYRLYRKNKGATTLSPLSEVLSLYKDKNSGYQTNSLSGRAVKININYEQDSSDVFSDDVYVQIYRINYIENGQPPKVILIVDQKYENGVEIIDLGDKNINTISISELLSYVQTGVVPQTIESKNNYLFAANLVYDAQTIDKLFESIANNYKDYFNIVLAYGALYILDESQQDNDFISSNAAVRPGETYRIGIIFYDNLGRKSSVFHLKDETIKDYDLWDDWCKLKDPNSNGGKIQYIINVPTIKIQLIRDIPGCSYYEIVRCIRTINDKRTITQGLLARPLELFEYSSTPNSSSAPNSSSKHIISSSGFMSMAKFLIGPDWYFSNLWKNEAVKEYATSCNNILLFASPEYVYQEDDVKNLLDTYKGILKILTAFEYNATLDETDLKYPAIYKQNTSNNLFRTNGEYYMLCTGCGYGSGLFEVTNSKSYLNVLYPHTKLTSTGSQYTINDLAYCNVPEWNDMAKEDSLRFKDDITQIGQYNYLEWTNPILYNRPTVADSILSKLWKDGAYQTVLWSDVATATSVMLPVGTTGKCILIETSNINNQYNTTTNNSNTVGSNVGPYLITVADIRKESEPYGGESDAAKRNSTYCSFGQVFKNSAGTRNFTNLNFGDCYIRLFKYNAAHSWYDTTYKHANKMATVYCVPMFMDIDLHAEFGDTYRKGRTKGYYILDKASAFDGYVQDKDAYLYNTAYNAHPDIISYSAYDKDNSLLKYDTRVHYSDQKANGESIDSWLQFKAMNFVDVDSQFGEITDMKLFKDRLMFWLQHASGILAVNERVILQDSNNTQVTLGTGAVLDRYDYISTIYGMKSNLHVSCVSNDAIYWWDGYNKEILEYSGKIDRSGIAVVPLTQINNIRNYINSGNESDKPHLYYDTKYKEVGCQCINNEVVVYNELLKKFTAVYTRRSFDMSLNRGFAPIYDAYIDNLLFLTDGKDIYESKQHSSRCSLLGHNVYPYIKYVVNANNTLSKTYDIQIIGGNLYGGSSLHIYDPNDLNQDSEKAKLFQNQPDVKSTVYWHKYHTNEPLESLLLRYTTPLKQEGIILYGEGITNREYDYRLNIPRQRGNDVYGGRLKGKTMQCELWSTSSSTDFSLQYITTKYRMSWS